MWTNIDLADRFVAQLRDARQLRAIYCIYSELWGLELGWIVPKFEPATDIDLSVIVGALANTFAEWPPDEAMPDLPSTGKIARRESAFARLQLIPGELPRRLASHFAREFVLLSTNARSEQDLDYVVHLIENAILGSRLEYISNGEGWPGPEKVEFGYVMFDYWC